MNRKILNFPTPVDEDSAKLRTEEAMEEWQETMRARRLCVFLMLAFWGLLGVFAWLAHRNWLAVLDFLFPAK